MIDQIGNYRVTDEIGSGGMAVVYKGVQESLKRTVAIKALKTSVSDDRDVVARFEREATSTASFQHENIITVYDFFRERGALFIVMEYVEGIDLYDLLDRSERLPPDVAAIISLQVARALDYAHFRAVIHRDVKPANIIISKLGTVKLTDFGIARIEESDLTEFGVGLGTPAYMSPEQALGARLDHRSDVFSLGIVLYQMVTGQKPFQEDSQRSVMDKIRNDPPRAPRVLNGQVPRDLERIILRCMEKDPNDRYGSTQELLVVLEQYLAANVNQNYRARLLMFLREHGVISSDETAATLHPALIGESYGRVPLLRIRRKYRRLLGLVTMAMVLLPSLGVLAWRLGLFAAPKAAIEYRYVNTGAPCLPSSDHKRFGLLEITAFPWARVEVDGKEMATTPFAQPIALELGHHRVRLTNPYFETVERWVEIKANKVHKIEAVLQRSSPPAAGKGDSADGT